MKGVIKRSKEDLDGLQPKDFDGYQIVNEGDLVFKLIDLAGVSTSRVGLSAYNGLVSPAYILLHADETRMRKEYATYFFLSLWYRLIFNEIGNGGIRSSLNSGDLLEIPITRPTLLEQQAIVSFLDSRCAKIDEAIERHKKIIEKLNEYKRSKIAFVVYSGLKDEEKQQTEEWCGSIPVSWTLPRIKFMLRERNIRSETGMEEPLSMSQKVGLVPTRELGDIPHGASTFIGAKIVEPDDLVFNKLKAHLGVFSVSRYFGLVSPDYAVYMATKKQMRQFFLSFPNANTLCSELSWSHYRMLMRVTDKAERDFYLEEAVRAGWSVRQLDRQINTFYYRRILASRDKDSVATEIETVEPRPEYEKIIKDPYVLEFLDLPPNEHFYESNLEQALIDHLQKFLLELGRGYSFVARQKHFRVDDEDFWLFVHSCGSKMASNLTAART